MLRRKTIGIRKACKLIRVILARISATEQNAKHFIGVSFFSLCFCFCFVSLFLLIFSNILLVLCKTFFVGNFSRISIACGVEIRVCDIFICFLVSIRYACIIGTVSRINVASISLICIVLCSRICTVRLVISRRFILVGFYKVFVVGCIDGKDGISIFAFCICNVLGVGCIRRKLFLILRIASSSLCRLCIGICRLDLASLRRISLGVEVITVTAACKPHRSKSLGIRTVGSLVLLVGGAGIYDASLPYNISLLVLAYPRCFRCGIHCVFGFFREGKQDLLCFLCILHTRFFCGVYACEKCIILLLVKAKSIHKRLVCVCIRIILDSFCCGIVCFFLRSCCRNSIVSDAVDLIYESLILRIYARNSIGINVLQIIGHALQILKVTVGSGVCRYSAISAYFGWWGFGSRRICVCCRTQRRCGRSTPCVCTVREVDRACSSYTVIIERGIIHVGISDNYALICYASCVSSACRRAYGHNVCRIGKRVRRYEVCRRRGKRRRDICAAYKATALKRIRGERYGLRTSAAFVKADLVEIVFIR